MESSHHLFFVVVNEEEQHSIWPSQKTVPDGWTTIGSAQPYQACLDYIEENWTDITPKSAR